jgi:hypothetical protein
MVRPLRGEERVREEKGESKEKIRVKGKSERKRG